MATRGCAGAGAVAGWGCLHWAVGIMNDAHDETDGGGSSGSEKSDDQQQNETDVGVQRRDVRLL
jgi:hypothetical protein